MSNCEDCIFFTVCINCTRDSYKLKDGTCMTNRYIDGSTIPVPNGYCLMRRVTCIVTAEYTNCVKYARKEENV